MYSSAFFEAPMEVMTRSNADGRGYQRQHLVLVVLRAVSFVTGNCEIEAVAFDSESADFAGVD